MRNLYLWYGRFIGVANLMYGVWLVLSTVIVLVAGAEFDSPWIAVLIACLGLAGAGGSLSFLISVDGPALYRTVGYRRVGWIVMFAAILLPTSISFFLAPLTALSVGLALRRPAEPLPESEKPARSG